MPALVVAIPVATVAISVLGSFFTARYIAQRQYRTSMDLVTQSAQTQYRFNALLKYNEQVKAPMGQVVESIHDAGDRLFSLLSDSSGEKRQWTEHESYFRQSFVWLLVRPLAWMEVLRARRTNLDLGIESIAGEDQRFQGLCRIYEISLHRAQLFAGTGYREGEATAHVFAGDLRRMAEVVIQRDGQRPIRYAAFVEKFCGAGPRAQELAPMRSLVSNLGDGSSMAQFKLARLLSVYVACNCILDTWRSPFRSRETPEDSLKWLNHIISDRSVCTLVRSNIEAKIIARARAL